MATNTQETESKFQELEEFIDGMPTTKGELIRVLHKAQELFGYLPQEVQVFVGKKLNIPTAKVFGVVTFYSYFTTTPKGQHNISVCLGTACYVKGIDKVLEEIKKELGIDIGETTKDGKFSITGLRCVGACGLAPVMMVDNKVYGRMKPEKVKEILNAYR
jgi:NADH-quinone oxidoreductase subunit E/NADP-reducing hydrogenase subunit HndA